MNRHTKIGLVIRAGVGADKLVVDRSRTDRAVDVCRCVRRPAEYRLRVRRNDACQLLAVQVASCALIVERDQEQGAAGGIVDNRARRCRPFARTAQRRQRLRVVERASRVRNDDRAGSCRVIDVDDATAGAGSSTLDYLANRDQCASAAGVRNLGAVSQDLVLGKRAACLVVVGEIPIDACYQLRVAAE